MKKLLFLLLLLCSNVFWVIAQTCDPPTSIAASVIRHERCAGGGEIQVTNVSPAPNAGESYLYRLVNANTNVQVKGWQASQLFTGGDIPSGSYKVEVKKLCPSNAPPNNESVPLLQSLPITVLNQLAVTTITSASQINPSNVGSGACCTGKIRVTVSGGRAPFTYVLVDGISPSANEISPRQSSNEFDNLCVGSYYVRIIDSCTNYITTTTPINVLPIPQPSINNQNVIKYSCDSFTFNFSMLNHNSLASNNFKYWIEWPNGSADSAFSTLPPNSVSGSFLMPFNLGKLSNSINATLPFPNNVGLSPKTFTVGFKSACGTITTFPYTVNPLPLTAFQVRRNTNLVRGCDSVILAIMLNYPRNGVQYDHAFNSGYNIANNTSPNQIFVVDQVYYSIDNKITWKPANATSSGFSFEILIKRQVDYSGDIFIAYCNDTVGLTNFDNNVGPLPSINGNNILSSVGYLKDDCSNNNLYATINRSRNFVGDSVVAEITWSDPPLNPQLPFTKIKVSVTGSDTIFRNLPLGRYEVSFTDSVGINCTRTIVDTIELMRRIFSPKLVVNNLTSCKGNSGFEFQLTNTGADNRNVTIQVLSQPANSNLPSVFYIPMVSSGINVVYQAIPQLSNIPQGVYEFRITDSVGLDANCIRQVTLKDTIKEMHVINNSISIVSYCPNGNLVVHQTDSLWENGLLTSNQRNNSYQLAFYKFDNTRVGSAFSGTQDGSIIGARKFEFTPSFINSLPNEPLLIKVYRNGVCDTSVLLWNKPTGALELSGTMFIQGCNGEGILIGIPNGSYGSPFEWQLEDLDNNIIVSARAQGNGIFTGLRDNGSYRLTLYDQCGQSTTFLSGNTDQLRLVVSGNSMLQCPGDNIVFNVPNLSGATYIWYKNNNVISGANGATLTLNNIQRLADSGAYKVRIILPTCTIESDEFILTVDCDPLPIKLASFDAYAMKNATALQWTTHSEFNNKGFDVQHSTNASTWNTIGFVNSLAENGNSSSVLQYSHKHNMPNEGVNYYRLKQVDFDGTSEFSKVVMVRFGANQSNISMYPNPANAEVTLKGLEGNEIITIYDVMGRMVLTTNARQSEVTISLQKLVSGTYTVKVQGEKEVTSLSLVKRTNN